MAKYTITTEGDISTISNGKQTFHIAKTLESYLIDGDYFCSYDELQSILAEIKLGDALSKKTDNLTTPNII